MTRRRFDVPAFVSGVAVLAVGAVLLLDRADVLELRFGVLAPLFLAAAGAILLATGLDHRDRQAGPRPGLDHRDPGIEHTPGRDSRDPEAEHRP